jgi:hypothetical protein
MGEQLCVTSKSISGATSVYAQGFFSDSKIGLFRRKRAQIALFSTGDRLWISIQCKMYDASHPSISVGRRFLFLGGFLPACEWSLRSEKEVLASFRYWSYPDDIFEYCERVTKSLESKKTFLHIWNENAAGREVSSKTFRPD